jgi:hypothetical protein
MGLEIYYEVVRFIPANKFYSKGLKKVVQEPNFDPRFIPDSSLNGQTLSIAGLPFWTRTLGTGGNNISPEIGVG